MDSLLSMQNWHLIPAYEYAGLDSKQASAGRKKDDEGDVYLTRCASLILPILAFHPSCYFLFPHIYFSSSMYTDQTLTVCLSYRMISQPHFLSNHCHWNKQWWFLLLEHVTVNVRKHQVMNPRNKQVTIRLYLSFLLIQNVPSGNIGDV